MEPPGLEPKAAELKAWTLTLSHGSGASVSFWGLPHQACFWLKTPQHGMDQMGRDHQMWPRQAPQAALEKQTGKEE